MKKVLLVAVAGVFALGLTSCKKDYKCVCKSSTENAGVEYVAGNYTNVTKSAATTSCDQFATLTTSTCEVK